MKYFIVAIFFLSSFFIFNYHFDVEAFYGEGVIISEFAPLGTQDSINNCKIDPSSRFTCSIDKWIELYNPSSQVVELSDYMLSFGYSHSREYFRTVELEGEIYPYSTFLIGNKNKTLESKINPNIEIGSLQVFSKKIDQYSSKINLTLSKKDGSIASQINTTFSCDQLSSIEIDTEGVYSCSTNVWKINENSQMHATPGFVSFTPSSNIVVQGNSEDSSIQTENNINESIADKVIDLKTINAEETNASTVGQAHSLSETVFIKEGGTADRVEVEIPQKVTGIKSLNKELNQSTPLASKTSIIKTDNITVAEVKHQLPSMPQINPIYNSINKNKSSLLNLEEITLNNTLLLPSVEPQSIFRETNFWYLYSSLILSFVIFDKNHRKDVGLIEIFYNKKIQRLASVFE